MRNMKKEDKENCVFCKILEGKSPVSMIYEDDKVAVFPPLNPVNDGHVLIIPKEHAPYLADIDVKTLSYIMEVAHKVAAAIKKSNFKCEGINYFLADGEVSGQEVFHLHLHVYPRFAGDGFGFKYDEKQNFIDLDRPKLDLIASEIKKHLVV